MQKCVDKNRPGWLPGLLVVGFMAAGAFAQPAEDPRLESDSSQAPAAVSKPASGISEWWLGVQCRPVNETLRAQLGLDEAEGLVAEKVVPDSPAAKAGLQRHDVLLMADGKPLSSPLDLIAAVSAKEGKELVVEYFRGGQKNQLTLHPERRPEWARIVSPATMAAQESQLLRKWLQQFQSAEPGSPLRFRFLHPGVILPPDAPSFPPLPADVSITITKRGSELAKVIVTRGEEKWEVAENELDKLPKELAPYVRSMLGRSLPDPRDAVQLYEFIPDWSDSAEAGTENPSPPETAQAEKDEGSGIVEQRLERMNRQLEQLRRTIEDLRKERSN